MEDDAFIFAPHDPSLRMKQGVASLRPTRAADFSTRYESVSSFCNPVSSPLFQKRCDAFLCVCVEGVACNYVVCSLVGCRFVQGQLVVKCSLSQADDGRAGCLNGGN